MDSETELASVMTEMKEPVLGTPSTHTPRGTTSPSVEASGTSVKRSKCDDEKKKKKKQMIAPALGGKSARLLSLKLRKVLQLKKVATTLIISEE